MIGKAFSWIWLLRKPIYLNTLSGLELWGETWISFGKFGVSSVEGDRQSQCPICALFSFHPFHYASRRATHIYRNVFMTPAPSITK
ncbi:hypothetical protein AFLA_005424 [Aspergillus flavus NRRL3357]|nr:hypothetical protein AFLA_005424 [Aspergillus flavus NRRL3357]